MSAVFLDTVGLLALWDAGDQWHPAAEAAFERIKVSRSQVVTTAYVLLECGNAAARKPYRQAVNRLRVKMEEASLLIQPTEDDWRQAWAAHVSGETREAGIVDHFSFAVMRRLQLRQAFANDRHFAAAGFEILF